MSEGSVDFGKMDEVNTVVSKGLKSAEKTSKLLTAQEKEVNAQLAILRRMDQKDRTFQTLMRARTMARAGIHGAAAVELMQQGSAVARLLPSRPPQADVSASNLSSGELATLSGRIDQQAGLRERLAQGGFSGGMQGPSGPLQASGRQLQQTFTELSAVARNLVPALASAAVGAAAVSHGYGTYRETSSRVANVDKLVRMGTERLGLDEEYLRKVVASDPEAAGVIKSLIQQSGKVGGRRGASLVPILDKYMSGAIFAEEAVEAGRVGATPWTKRFRGREILSFENADTEERRRAELSKYNTARGSLTPVGIRHGYEADVAAYRAEVGAPFLPGAGYAGAALAFGVHNVGLSVPMADAPGAGSAGAAHMRPAGGVTQPGYGVTARGAGVTVVVPSNLEKRSDRGDR